MSELWTRWCRLPLWVRDGVLALVVTGLGQVELIASADEVAGSLPLQHAAFAAITGSLLIRRSRPVVAAVVVAAGLAVQTLLGEAPVVAGFLAVLVVTYSVAQYADRRRDALLGLVLIVGSIQLYPLVAERDVRVADELANAAIPVVVWIFARLARERLDRAVRAERTAAAERERAREAELERTRALGAERRRIARDMHDVVGHGVTLMLLHAEAAQVGLGGREPDTAARLDVVLDAGRTALDDLHRLLRVLRQDEPGASAEAGTLADLERLVEAAGPEVTLRVEGTPQPVAAAVEATVHRVVQESLTNARKHAPGAAVQVRVRWSEASLEVEVTDDGRGGGNGHRTGFGLVGMRERVALFDGRVSAGPRSDGPGWRTTAVLPLRTVAPLPA